MSDKDEMQGKTQGEKEGLLAGEGTVSNDDEMQDKTEIEMEGQASEGRDRKFSVATSETGARESVTSSTGRPSASQQLEINMRVSEASAEVYLNLPEHSYSQEVVDYIMSIPKGEEVDIATCLGPAVPKVRFISVLETIAVFLFLPITYLFDVYHLSGSWKYLLAAPVGIYGMYIESEALRHLVPPYVYDAVRHTTSLWQVFGKKASFQVWHAVYAFFTILSSADSFLDTGFAATQLFVMANDNGHTQAIFEEMWHKKIFGYEIPCPSMIWLVLTMWLCTFVQPIFNLIYTIPMGPVNYAIGDNGLQFYLFQRLNFEGVFFFLSAATGMSSIQSLEFRQGLHELARVQPEEMISYVQPMALGMFKRICYSWFLRNCIQLNLQTSIFAIHMHARLSGTSGAAKSQTQTAVSIAVSIMMTLQKLTEIVAFEKYVKQAKEMWATDEELDRYIEQNPKNHLFKEWKDGFWKLQWSIRFVVLLTVGSLALATSRLFMSTYVCESRLWEMSRGCIEMGTHHSLKNMTLAGNMTAAKNMTAL